MKINYFTRKSNVISVMQKSSRVYVYGAGEYGYSVGEFLKELNIPIAAFVVDDEFFNLEMKICIPSSQNVMHSVPYRVIPMKEYINSTDNFSESFLIWAISSPSKLKKALDEDILPIVWLTYDVYSMWSDNLFAHKNAELFAVTRELLVDLKSKETLDAYLEIYSGNPENDIAVLEDNTYFNNLTFDNREGCFVDCGAYTGDTAIMYAELFGKNRKIYAFEPDPENYIKLKQNTENLNIVTVNAGCWSEDRVLRFNDCGNPSSSIQQDGGLEIKVVSIDSIVGYDKVAFIKMDVEGCEYQALKGAESTIKRDMPILAISAYHKQEDLITLPQYLYKFENDEEYYSLYLRHHGCTTPELVLYAIPTQK